MDETPNHSLSQLEDSANVAEEGLAADLKHAPLQTLSIADEHSRGVNSSSLDTNT